MSSPRLTISVLPGRLAVSRLSPQQEIPDWAEAGPLLSITRTADELSIICREDDVPAGVQVQKGWRALRLEGPFEFSEVGILLSVAAPLAEASISILALATYDTDYVLICEPELERAVSILTARGHRILR